MQCGQTRNCPKSCLEVTWIAVWGSRAYWKLPQTPDIFLQEDKEPLFKEMYNLVDLPEEIEVNLPKCDCYYNVRIQKVD